MPSYKLIYFDVRARGEVMRMMFKASGTPFEDQRVLFENWPAMKASMGMLAQLPVLEVDGQSFSQSTALTTFVASELGFCGKNNLDRLQCEEIFCATSDLLEKFAKCHFEKDEAKKSEMKEKLKSEEVPMFLKFFEAKLTKNGSGFFVGNQLSMADMALYDVLTTPVKNDAAMLKDYPKITANRAKVEANPKLGAYLKSRPASEM